MCTVALYICNCNFILYIIVSIAENKLHVFNNFQCNVIILLYFVLHITVLRQIVQLQNMHKFQQGFTLGHGVSGVSHFFLELGQAYTPA